MESWWVDWILVPTFIVSVVIFGPDVHALRPHLTIISSDMSVLVDFTAVLSLIPLEHFNFTNESVDIIHVPLEGLIHEALLVGSTSPRKRKSIVVVLFGIVRINDHGVRLELLNKLTIADDLLLKLYQEHCCKWQEQEQSDQKDDYSNPASSDRPSLRIGK